MRIDSHVYFDQAHPPEHLQSILSRNRFDAAILVVGGPELPETGPHIAGIVARRLDRHRKDPRVRGLLVNGVPENAEELAQYGIPLDLEIRTTDFPALVRLAERLPDLRLAIDHLARPAFHLPPADEWLRGMAAAARFPHIYCKISGLLTEVERLPWPAATLRPFVDHALAVFGPSRLMFGSEWPIRLPEVTWKESLAAFTQALGARSIELREQLLGATAREFYSLADRA